LSIYYAHQKIEGFCETMLPRSKLPVPINEELWEELRTKVDAKIPRRIQVEVYAHLDGAAKKREREIGKRWLGGLHYRPCDYGLVFLYFLVTSGSCRSLEFLGRK